jgi:hypothetical protein
MTSKKKFREALTCTVLQSKKPMAHKPKTSRSSQASVHLACQYIGVYTKI